MYTRVHVKRPLFLPNFSEICISSTYFRKKTQISNFIKVRPVGAQLFHPDGQTDMTTLKVACLNFAKVLKNSVKEDSNNSRKLLLYLHTTSGTFGTAFRISGCLKLGV